MRIKKYLIPIFLSIFLLIASQILPKESFAQSEINIQVNPMVIKNEDFGQILGGYLSTRANLNPASKFSLSQQAVVQEAKKMFPQPPEFPTPAVMRTQSYKMLDNDYFAITDEEVEDVIKFCSLANCDPMFGALGEGPVETHDGISGKVIDVSPSAIRRRAIFVKEKCQQYFGDNQHCLHWDIGNEPPSPPQNCQYYGTTLIPSAIRTIKEVIPNAIFHTPELYLDSAKVRNSNMTIGECITKTLQETAPDLKIDVFTTHWYPYVCTGSPLNITGNSVLNWAGNGGPNYQKMTYPYDIVSGINSWLKNYLPTKNSVIGLGEFNPMGNCYEPDTTARLNLTWGGAFWHLDTLGIMAEAGIKYCQKHIHISGSGGRYEAMVVSQGKVFKTPAYFAYRFYSQYFGRRIISSTSFLPQTLNSHAALDKDGNIRLALINKTSSFQKAKVNILNFQAQALGISYKMKSPKDFGESPAGFDENSVYSVTQNIPVGNNFEYTVEPYTAVVLKIPGQIQPSNCPSGEKGNLNCSSDEKINSADLNILLSSWAPRGPVPVPPPGQREADLNNDNKVNEKDLTILLKNWKP